jgi:hypothetical protein
MNPEIRVIRATTPGTDESGDPGDPVNQVSSSGQIVIYAETAPKVKIFSAVSFILHEKPNFREAI